MTFCLLLIRSQNEVFGDIIVLAYLLNVVYSYMYIPPEVLCFWNLVLSEHKNKLPSQTCMTHCVPQIFKIQYLNR